MAIISRISVYAIGYSLFYRDVLQSYTCIDIFGKCNNGDCLI